MPRRLPSPGLLIDRYSGKVKERAIPTTLYFIECESEDRHIKIGIAGNVRSRMSKMQMDCPYRLRLIKRVLGAADREYELHNRFAADKLYGEWFRRSDELLAVIAAFDGLDYLESTSHEDYPAGHILVRHQPTPYLDRTVSPIRTHGE